MTISEVHKMFLQMKKDERSKRDKFSRRIGKLVKFETRFWGEDYAAKTLGNIEWKLTAATDAVGHDLVREISILSSDDLMMIKSLVDTLVWLAAIGTTD